MNDLFIQICIDFLEYWYPIHVLLFCGAYLYKKFR